MHGDTDENPPPRSRVTNGPVARVSLDSCRTLLVVAAITLGVMARAATVRSPLFDFHSWRQADTASIARNFVEERFNPMYPQVDQRGARAEGYVKTGLELHAFIVAALAKVVGFSPQLGRLVNTLLFPVAALLLFRFIQDRYGETAGFIGLFIYAVGLPLQIFIDRAFMNESVLVLLTIVCLWAAQQYCARLCKRHVAVLIGTSSLLAVVKPTYLIVWGAIAGLFLERFGRAAFVRWELWLMAAVNLGLGTLWFRHAGQISQLTGISFGLADKLFSADVLFSDYLPKVAIRLLKDIIGPVGVVFGSYGAIVAAQQRRYAERCGLITFAAYLIVVTVGNFSHNYYQLPIVPVATVLTAAGVTALIGRIGTSRNWSSDTRINAYAAILWIAAMSTFIRSVSAHNWYEVDQRRVRMCETLARVLAPDERVVFANYKSPDILFCIHRKGWLLTDEETTPERLHELANDGAPVFVTEKRYEQTVRTLQNMAEPLVDTPEFAAYRVRKN
jgi:hypothetical protein